MNMFKKSRKAKDQDEAHSTLTGAGSAPMVKAPRSLTFKRKKQEIEEKPTFDLSSALPDTNEFRTSLLMPNLSARFSMLREQDDPNSKLGKASDDSVLFPRRASRVMLFNQNHLADIAEVESIRSSFKPPFVDERSGSVSDGYASDDGASVMNRSRPGEGNNLFGGRQKLYKITTGSSKNVGGESAMTSGKHMYESDVALSAFQKLRLKEKEERDRQRDADEAPERHSYPHDETDEQDSSRSPLMAFSKNRGTQSSTNSAPSNRPVSTAATSIVSDSPMPQQTSHAAIHKVREQDANSSAESIGFASSPSLRKVRDDGSRAPFRLSQSRSAMNMRDHYSRQSPIPSSHAFRTMSPPLSASSQPLDFGLRETMRSQNSSRFNNVSPTSQQELDQDETLAINVRPNDRGKATAMGLFNKPAQHFDEAQFQQRQLQMHEGRNSPMSVNSRAASRASPEPMRSGGPSYSSLGAGMPRGETETPQMPPMPDYPASPVAHRKETAASSARQSTSRPRTKSPASTKEAAVKARVESLIRKQNAELAVLEATQLGPIRNHAGTDDGDSSENQLVNRTFFDNSDDSEDEDSRGPATTSIANAPPAPPPPSDVHPALRDAAHNPGPGVDRRQYLRESHYSVASSRGRKSMEKARQSKFESVVSVDEGDPSTLPTAGLGLSGLIRTHLRQDSDKSSLLTPLSPALQGEGFRGSVVSATQTATDSIKSDPFEYDNERLNAPQHDTIPPRSPTPTTAMSMKAQQILGTAMALRAAAAKAEQTPKPNEHVDELGDGQTTDQVKSPHHQRNLSTETTREMRRFDEELAARRKKIEEGLQRVQERSRSRSPTGFSLAKFSGRSNTGDRFEPQNKAMKMLGISGPSRDQQPSARMPPEPADERSRSQNTSRQGQRTPSAQASDRPHAWHTPNSGRQAPRSGSRNAPDRPPPPRSTTPSSRPGARSRSTSAAADRAASRNKYIPDFDRSMLPGAFPGSPYPSESPQYDHSQRSDSPANRYERSGSSAASHYNDRPGYFNSKSLGPPEMSGEFTPRASPRPSPKPTTEFYQAPLAAPMSPPSSAQPSPNPAASNGHTTPSVMQLPGRVTPSGHRKRSVTKGMISEPTFVSSTSTVPLVYLPKDGGPTVEPLSAPPVPLMNPRRRGTGGEASPGFAPHPGVRPAASPLSGALDSPKHHPDLGHGTSPPSSHSKLRNKLRKSSSEGGNMAAKARQQALAAEMARENDRSPHVSQFHFSRSATNLDDQHAGGMF